MSIPTLIKTLTASADASLSFVDGTASVVLDSTYDEYWFVLTNIGPATDSVNFLFNGSIDSGSNYNVTKTTTSFAAQNSDQDENPQVAYSTGNDLAQGTGFQMIASGAGNDADQSINGILKLFTPANTTYVKHFMGTFNWNQENNYSMNTFIAGYLNTTSAIDAIQFKTSSGNFDGVIQMYGVA